MSERMQDDRNYWRDRAIQLETAINEHRKAVHDAEERDDTQYSSEMDEDLWYFVGDPEEAGETEADHYFWEHLGIKVYLPYSHFVYFDHLMKIKRAAADYCSNLTKHEWDVENEAERMVAAVKRIADEYKKIANDHDPKLTELRETLTNFYEDEE